ncbi:S41 family peptidase [bacterium]|nr:S41 family peptidase [bacterium]
MNIMKKSVFALAALVMAIPPSFAAESQTALYDQVWRLINTKYVDSSNNMQDWSKWRRKYDNYIKTDEDSYMAIRTMLASLDDQYTRFLDPKEFAEETSSIRGSLKGIGVQIGTRDGKLMVIAPLEDTPAEKAGILADDEIIEIDGESTKGITVEKAADKIKGEEGTTVTLVIKRKDELKTFHIRRQEIELKAVSTKVPNDVKLNPQIGYVRLSSFISKNAAAEFEKAMIDQADKKGYIIDLRSNPGGLLTNAVLISNMFLSSKVVVSTVDRDGYKETLRTMKPVLTNKPLVVLINKGSASASEITSGALHDNGRAVLIGEQSFGKGLVQEINKLPDGSGVNITIQKYYTPNGTDINKKGITPDIIVELTEDDIEKKNDTQLIRANDVLTKMINKSNS